MAFMVSILVLPFILVLGGNEGAVTKYGIYTTALFAAVSFVMAFSSIISMRRNRRI